MGGGCILHSNRGLADDVVAVQATRHSSLDPARITEAIPQRSEPEIHKWLAERIGQQYRDNAFKASWIQWMATVAVAAVGVEFFALALQLVRIS